MGLPTRRTAAADTTGGELAYVTNEGSGELTIIDASNDSVVGTITVGTRPRGIRLSQDGRTAYVALSGSPRCPPTMPDEECEKLKADKSKDGIGVIDVASRKVTKVLPGGSDPEAFDISQDGTRLFVSNEDANSATIVDIASGKVLSTVPVGREPEGVELHPERQGGVGDRGDRSRHQRARCGERQDAHQDRGGQRRPRASSSPAMAAEPM